MSDMVDNVQEAISLRDVPTSCRKKVIAITHSFDYVGVVAEGQ